MKKVYIIGSLANPRVPEVAKELQQAEYDAFADWYGAGPEADKCWQAYQQSMGRSYIEALEGPAAQTIFLFDKHHIDESDAVVLVAPYGKSAGLELGYAIGTGKVGIVLMECEPEKWDVMLNFADAVVDSMADVIDILDSALTC